MARHLVKVVSHRYQYCMIDPVGTPDRIAELLVHVGRAAQCEDGRSELTAAQWTCLRFFSRANGSTRTPSGFASFQATTRGTASQIIKTLEGRGLIRRHRSDRDRRSVRFDLTDDGLAMLSRDPMADLIGVIGHLGASNRARFLDTLSHVASAIAALREVPAFGSCRDCCHFTASGGSGHCACMAAELAAGEIDKLCASYRGPAGAPAGPAADPAPASLGEHDGTD